MKDFMYNPEKKARSKRFSATFLIAVVCLVVLFSANFASAAFLPIKSYDKETDTFTLSNFLGLGKDYVKGRLTWGDTKVGVGKDTHVGTFEYTPLDEDAYIQDLDLINLKNGQVMTRGEQYKVLTYVEDDKYKTVCEKVFDDKNKTYYDSCEQIENGTYLKEEWKPLQSWLNKNNFIVGETYTIGVFVDTEEGDYGDWIPSFMGFEISEWATWSASLETDLHAYYKFDNSTGVLYDMLKNQDGTVTGTDRGQTGLIDSAINFDNGVADSDYIEIGYINYNGADDFTICGWFNPDSTSNQEMLLSQWHLSSSTKIALIAQNSGYFGFNLDGDAAPGTISATTAYTAGSWNFACAMYDGTAKNMSVWFNGNFEASQTDSFGTGDFFGNSPFYFGKLRSSNDADYDGLLDEWGIWNRTLSPTEIEDLYNSGNGLTYTVESLSGLDITLNSPANNYNSSSDTITFNVTVTDDLQVTNVSLLIDGTIDQTNTSQYNGTYIFTKSALSDGDYNWSILAFDNDSNNATSTTRDFSIDTISPNVSITAPTGALNYFKVGNNETLNYTASDTHIDSCWYKYNGINNTLNCSGSSVEFVYVDGVNNLTVYVNDTHENINSDSTSWSYKFVEVQQNYSSSVVEASSSLFSYNATVGSGYRVTSVILKYNNTDYSAFINNYDTNKYYFYRTINIPGVNSDTNKSFYWTINLDDSSSFSSDSLNQTVLNIDVDDCSVNNYTVLNFTVYDEDDLSLLNATGDEVDIKMSYIISNAVNGDTIINFSKFFNDTNPAAFCVNNNLGGSTFKLNGLTEYTANGYFTEFYNIQEQDLTTSDLYQNISLYSLNSSVGQEFKVTYKGEDFLAQTGVLLNLQRQYIDDGIFRTVEIPITSASGYALAHLIPNDAVYNLVFIEDGVTLDTFSNVIATCQNPTLQECEINVNALINSISLIDEITEDGFTSSLSYNKNTRTVSASYTITSGQVENVSLEVVLLNNYANTTVCYDSLLSSGGTLSCVIPASYTNSTVYAKLVYDGDVKRSGYLNINDIAPKDKFSGILVLASIILLLFILGIGVSDNPAIFGIFLILGVILLVGLNLVYSSSWLGVGATALWLIIAIIVVIVKGGKR